ncbi:MAG TPA: FkbM family methyltransferase [Chitinophagaceae bacterium]|nr:FkbM family methyltransferase [Chitinophagaceae bacterium]
MIKRWLKRIYGVLTLKPYRDEVIANQLKQLRLSEKIYEQLFLNNPVLVLNGVKFYLPLFYIDHLQKIIFQNRDYYEKETLSYLKTNFGQFETIVDVGANIGNHMLFFCSQMEAQKVYCFEPNQYTCSVLTKNVELNGLGKTVEIHQSALGEKKGHGIQQGFSLTNTGMNRIVPGGETLEDASVEIICLDDFNYSKTDFIKIDVEGFELAVLKGAEKTILRTRPVIMIEVFDDNKMIVDDIMRSYGYRKSVTLEEYNCIYIVDQPGH